MNEASEIYNCPKCEDRDCKLNCIGLCNDIQTILNRIPSGMYTCSSALIGFKRNDYLK